jgi:hypothetical protein
MNSIPTRQLIALLTGLLPLWLAAQAPSLPCPSTAITLRDSSANSAFFWNGSPWWDPRLSSQNLAEAVFSLPVEAHNYCDSGTLHFKFQLELDLDGDQLPETLLDSDSLPARNTVWFGSLNGSGTARSFDSRPVSADSLWGFALAILPSADSLHRAQIVWENNAGERTFPQLPYGNHRLTWLVTDACGQRSTCTRALQVRDGAPPTIHCLNSVSVNLQPIGADCQAVLFVSDFIQYIEDNYLESNQVFTVSLRRAGSGSGFPLQPDGSPVHQLTLLYDDLGVLPIEIWAMDVDSNAQSCMTLALVNNPQGCDEPMEPIECTGYITTIEGEPIDDVIIQRESLSNGFPSVVGPPVWGPDGCYQIFNGEPVGPAFRIRPSQDIDPLNGVSVWDLVLISRHILALQPISSPYYLIAADANRSNTVTTLDIVELRKLILGIYSYLPFNTSWRFIDQAQVFPDSLNPFLEPIRDTLRYSPLQTTGLDFYGIKVGDVDGSAAPNNLLGLEDRTHPVVYFEGQRLDSDSWILAPGEEARLVLTGPEDLVACQLALSFPSLELLEVYPSAGLLPEQIHSGSSYLRWVNERGTGQVSLRVRAREALSLEQAFFISENELPARAYWSNGEVFSLQVRFRKNQPNPSDLLYSVRLFPNPWKEATQLNLDLKEACSLELQLLDGLGRVWYVEQRDLPSGPVSWIVSGNWPAGSYYYRLRGPEGIISDTMIKY